MIGGAEAEAELAALEELRLNRAMAFVSISPSSVGEGDKHTKEDSSCWACKLMCVCVCVCVCACAGGCMSLEEVRLKQQQEMMQAKRKQTLV